MWLKTTAEDEERERRLFHSSTGDPFNIVQPEIGELLYLMLNLVKIGVDFRQLLRPSVAGHSCFFHAWANGNVRHLRKNPDLRCLYFYFLCILIFYIYFILFIFYFVHFIVSESYCMPQSITDDVVKIFYWMSSWQLLLTILAMLKKRMNRRKQRKPRSVRQPLKHRYKLGIRKWRRVPKFGGL